MEVFFAFVAISIIGLFAYGLQILAVRSSFRNKPVDKYLQQEGEINLAVKNLQPTDSFLPPISILKPLKGLDDNLFDNLVSFCTQDYPKYEIILSLQDYNDPAYKVAKKVKDKYPEKDISIIVEKCDIGLNPKVNNLIPAYRASNYDLILISDSNVMVGNDYLKETVKHMKDVEVGLVSNVIKGIGGSTIGSIFENLHLNSFVIGSVCFLDRFLKIPCVVGKSMLIRRQDLEAIGGFRAVKDYLAEDYIIGERIHKRNRKVILSNYAVHNVNEYWSFRKFLNRHTRWGKLRWRIGGIKYLSELLANPVFISLLPLFLWEMSFITIAFAFLVATLKVSGDFYLGRLIDNDFNPSIYLLSPFKDLIIGLIWFVPLFSKVVIWRGNKYVIGKDSLLSAYPQTGISSWGYKIFETIKAKIA
ncbi:MAG: ceramide glucosyltransferase [Thermodesulfovibrionales bacterium]|nr:ceramide glucosyltransferase [Thermodesulfovibrionales bacterium]